MLPVTSKLINLLLEISAIGVKVQVANLDKCLLSSDKSTYISVGFRRAFLNLFLFIKLGKFVDINSNFSNEFLVRFFYNNWFIFKLYIIFI